MGRGWSLSPRVFDWPVALADRDPRGIHSRVLGGGSDANAPRKWCSRDGGDGGNGGVSHEMRERGARRMKFTASVTREKGSGCRHNAQCLSRSRGPYRWDVLRRYGDGGVRGTS